MKSHKSIKSTLVYGIIWGIPAIIFCTLVILLHNNLQAPKQHKEQQQTTDSKQDVSLSQQEQWDRVSPASLPPKEINSFIQQKNKKWIIQTHSFPLNDPETAKVMVLLHKRTIHLPIFTNTTPLCSLATPDEFSLHYKIVTHNLNQLSFSKVNEASVALQIQSYPTSKIQEAYKQLNRLTEKGYCAYLTHSKQPLIKGKNTKPTNYIFLRVGFFISRVDAFATQEKLLQDFPEIQAKNKKLWLVYTNTEEKNLELVNFQNERSLPVYAYSKKTTNFNSFLPYLANINDPAIFAFITQEKSNKGYYYRLYIGQFTSAYIARVAIRKLNKSIRHPLSFSTAHYNHSITTLERIKQEAIEKQRQEEEAQKQAEQEKQEQEQEQEQPTSQEKQEATQPNQSQPTSQETQEVTQPNQPQPTSQEKQEATQPNQPQPTSQETQEVTQPNQQQPTSQETQEATQPNQPQPTSQEKQEATQPNQPQPTSQEKQEAQQPNQPQPTSQEKQEVTQPNQPQPTSQETQEATQPEQTQPTEKK